MWKDILGVLFLVILVAISWQWIQNNQNQDQPKPQKTKLEVKGTLQGADSRAFDAKGNVNYQAQAGELKFAPNQPLQLQEILLSDQNTPWKIQATRAVRAQDGKMVLLDQGVTILGNAADFGAVKILAQDLHYDLAGQTMKTMQPLSMESDKLKLTANTMQVDMNTEVIKLEKVHAVYLP